MGRVYRIHGVRFRSFVSLPELEPESAVSIDAVIRPGRVKIDDLAPNGQKRRLAAEPGRIRIAWEGVGAFELRKGWEMIVDADRGAEPELVRLFILGAAMGLLLHQRGLTVLHASVVAIGGQATAFVGEKGWGKSTLSAALVAQGYELVSDDIAAIELLDGEPIVHTGTPHIKLWPNSIVTIGGDPDEHPCLHSRVQKRTLRANRRAARRVTPLRRLVSLGLAKAPELRRVSPAQALFDLLPHWYGARYGSEVIKALGMREHFTQCSSLVNGVDCRRLLRTADLSQLDEVVSLAMQSEPREQAVG
jgi:hypothetical protein